MVLPSPFKPNGPQYQEISHVLSQHLDFYVNLTDSGVATQHVRIRHHITTRQCVARHSAPSSFEDFLEAILYRRYYEYGARRFIIACCRRCHRALWYAILADNAR